MADAWPTEAAATAAVEAAAKKTYEDGRAAAERVGHFGITPWDDLAPAGKHAVKQQVLPLVWAALESLTDPRHTSWLEGLYCGLRGGYEDDNPYPEPQS